MRLIAVDDERFALMDIMEAIRKAVPGAEPEGFSSPESALCGARRSPVDVAFLDIEMAGINGLELARRLKDIRGETNIIFVTGHSEYAVDAFSMFASGYLLKPVAAKQVAAAMEHLRNPLRREDGEKRIRVQTFGNFEVFCDGRPLHFSRSKAKELFAYLVHKRGTACTTREIAAVLYGDQPYTPSLQKQVQTVLSAMMRTFQENGVRGCIIRGYNRTAVDASKIDCDLYRFLSWDVEAVNEYMGEYMTSYSWAEFVTGYLDSRIT